MKKLVVSSCFLTVSMLLASSAFANSTTACTNAIGSLTYSQTVVGQEDEKQMPQDGGQWVFRGKKVVNDFVPGIDGRNVIQQRIHPSLDRSSKTLIETHMALAGESKTTYFIKAQVKIDAFTGHPERQLTEYLICEQTKN